MQAFNWSVPADYVKRKRTKKPRSHLVMHQLMAWVSTVWVQKTPCCFTTFFLQTVGEF